MNVDGRWWTLTNVDERWRALMVVDDSMDEGVDVCIVVYGQAVDLSDGQ
jgi:hypothetical protein